MAVVLENGAVVRVPPLTQSQKNFLKECGCWECPTCGVMVSEVDTLPCDIEHANCGAQS